jgi:hypothetical protein
VAEIRVIVDKVLASQSVNSVAAEHGIDPRTLHKRLKRVELKGWVTYDDEIVRDDEGLPVMRPPIVDARPWDQLQAKLQANSRGPGCPTMPFRGFTSSSATSARQRCTER